jgi:uncharacterized pyridoxamine 5'-phosphate oxidase family protein
MMSTKKAQPEQGPGQESEQRCEPGQGQKAESGQEAALRQVAEYLTGVPAWFLATSVNNRPHVRPFSFAVVENERLWFCTSKGKDVYDELVENPHFELSAWAPGKPWIIVGGSATFAEPTPALRQAGFEHMVSLGEAHRDANDGLLVFFFVRDATARICDIDGTERRFKL